MEHKSSINFKAVKANSERHNKAENRKTLDYVRTDLTHNNTQWMATSISKKRKEIIQRHNEYHTEVKTFICPKTGKEKTTKRLKKKFHSTAVPIKEAVVNLKRQSTWKDLLKVAEVIEKDFGPRCFQAFIHKDEGRYADQQDIDRGKATRINQWIPNSHAHLLFDWTDKVTGRPLRLNQLAMRKIQTKVADVLGMERGVEGSKAKRLESFDYKLNQSQKKLDALTQEIKQKTTTC